MIDCLRRVHYFGDSGTLRFDRWGWPITSNSFGSSGSNQQAAMRRSDVTV
jgi:hypothetical protein